MKEQLPFQNILSERRAQKHPVPRSEPVRFHEPGVLGDEIRKNDAIAIQKYQIIALARRHRLVSNGRRGSGKVLKPCGAVAGLFPIVRTGTCGATCATQGWRSVLPDETPFY